MPAVRPEDIAHMRPNDLLGAVLLFDNLYVRSDG